MSEPRVSIRLSLRPLLAALGLLLVPLTAMRLTDAVNWTVGDFVFAGALVFAAGLVLELAARKTEDHAYRNAVGVALAAVFFRPRRMARAMSAAALAQAAVAAAGLGCRRAGPSSSWA